jgi:hypothetical protein
MAERHSPYPAKGEGEAGLQCVSAAVIYENLVAFSAKLQSG